MFNNKKKKKKKAVYAQTRGGDRKALFGVISIALALIIFVVLTMIQNKIVHSVEKTTVYVASADVPVGIVVTENNAGNYFHATSRTTADLPKGVVTDISVLYGCACKHELYKNETILLGDFTDKAFIYDIDDPVEISLDASSIAQVAGGILRAGDLIDMKVVVDITGLEKMEDVYGAETMYGQDEYSDAQDVPGVPEDVYITEEAASATYGVISDDNTEEEDIVFDIPYPKSVSGRYVSVPILTNVHVVNVFTSGGTNTESADNSDVDQVATVINVVIPREMEDAVMLALQEGTLRIAKVLSSEEAIKVMEEQKKKVKEEQMEAQKVNAQKTETVVAPEKQVVEVEPVDEPIEEIQEISDDVEQAVATEG